ncbi:unnamed protein product [Diamesa hyperborea]
MSTQIYICHNVAENKSFEVTSLDLVPQMYYLNTYLIKICFIPNQLNFVQELISNIHKDNLWKLTGLYVVDFERRTSEYESSKEYTIIKEEDFTPLTSSTIIIFSEDSYDCYQLTTDDTSSIEEEDLTLLTINSSYNSNCSGNIINPLHNNCSDIIDNPIFQQTEDFYDCTLTFNDTSSIYEDDFTPITSSTINTYSFDSSDNIKNPLHNDCSDIIANPIFQKTEDFYDCTQSSFNDTST